MEIHTWHYPIEEIAYDFKSNFLFVIVEGGLTKLDLGFSS